MSLLRFNFPRNLCPPDEYVYHHADGHVTQAKDQDSWMEQIRKHFTDNGYPIPGNIEQLAADQLCRVLPPGFCQYEDGSKPRVHVSKRFTLEDVTHGMSVLASVMTFSEPLVDQGTADARAAICASCPANVEVAGCKSCANVAEMIIAIKGARKAANEPVLRSCAVCRCYNKAQVWVKAEHLAKGVSEEQLREFRAMEWCWKWKEIDAINAATT